MEFWPLTIPAHPQRRITGRSVAAKIRAARAREYALWGIASLTRLGLFRTSFIVQVPQTNAGRKSTSINVAEILIGSLV